MKEYLYINIYIYIYILNEERPLPKIYSNF